jgi:MATE family multidrug resistance protein
MVAIIFATINGSILLSIRNYWGYVWNPDPEVASLIAKILPLAACFQLSDAVGGVTSGILRGVGLQKVGAYINLCGYYLFGLPIGLLLTFPPKSSFPSWGLQGVWSGLTMALLTVSVVQLVLISRINWTRESERAVDRVRDDGTEYDAQLPFYVEEDSSLLA